MPFRKSAIAVFAVMSLLALASPAMATTFFDAGYYPAELKGEASSSPVFGVDGQSASCNTATFSGTQNEPSEAIELGAAFSGCTAFGFAGATVAMNTCKFKLNVNSATAGIICGETPIKIKSSVFGSTCEVQIGESGNTNLSKISNKTVANSPKTVTTTFELSGVTANKTADTGICPLSGAGTTNKATLNGQISLGAIGPGGKVNFVVEAFAPPVLCKEFANPCANAWPAVGTSMRALVVGAIAPTFKFEYAKAEKVVSCEESEIQPTTDNNGVATLNGAVSILSFSKCNAKNCNVTTSNRNYKMLMMKGGEAQGNGRVEIARGAGGGDPTFTITCNGQNACAYVTPVLWSKFTGGQPASLTLDKRENINPVAGNPAECGPTLTLESYVYTLQEPEANQGKAWLIS